MTVPGYTDVSHFRMPYKNSYLYTGVGEEPAPTLAPEEAVRQYVEESRGRLRYKSKVAAELRGVLKGYQAIFLSPQAVKVVQFTPEEFDIATKDPQAAAMLVARSAATWLEQKLTEGNTVLASVGFVVPGASDMQLAAVPWRDTDGVKVASRMMPVLAETATASVAGFMTSPLGLALGAAVVGGAAYSYLRRRRRITI